MNVLPKGKHTETGGKEMAKEYWINEIEKGASEEELMPISLEMTNHLEPTKSDKVHAEFGGGW
jgi:hypothetical protein